jgi:glycosyltransferase involved in cell wall biosynthesis
VGEQAVQGQVALVHDYLNQYGGAERVLEALHELFPDAPVFTSMYDPGAMPPAYRSWDIRTSFMQRLPGVHRHHQIYLPLYPLAFRCFRLDGYRVVLSSSSAFAKGMRPAPGALHVCYCHSPMRFAWTFRQYAEREQIGPLLRRALPPLLAWLRRWDVATAQRVDVIVANSTAVAQRIRAWWGREATVIFPPVDVERARPAPPGEIGDYFLLVSRLVPYKRIDLAIAAFNALGLPLKIVGDGRDRAALMAQAGPTIEFLGQVPEDEKFHLYAHCRAAVFPAEDDFGIAQVEVQAAGRPAIALARGGALDTVVDGVTGVLFPDQTVESLIEAVRRFERLHFSTGEILRQARRFSRARFKEEMRELIERELEARRAAPSASVSEEVQRVWS